MQTHLIWIVGFQIDSVEQPINDNSVGSGHVSHRWTSSFDNHFDDSFSVSKNVQLELILTRMCVSGHVIHIRQLINLLLSVVSWCFGFGFLPCTSFPDAIMAWFDSVVS